MKDSKIIEELKKITFDQIIVPFGEYEIQSYKSSSNGIYLMNISVVDPSGYIFKVLDALEYVGWNCKKEGWGVKVDPEITEKSLEMILNLIKEGDLKKQQEQKLQEQKNREKKQEFLEKILEESPK